MRQTAAPVPWPWQRRAPGRATVSTWFGLRQHPPGALLLSAVLATALVAVPVVYLFVRAAQGDAETWARVLSRRVPGLLANSFKLAIGSTSLALALGVPLGWLVTRTDLPGRRWLSWMAALPLAIPPYVGAIAYISFAGPRGLLEKALSRLSGVPGPELGLPSIFGLPGTTLILALFTYPYVYLLAASAFRGLNQSLEEAARSAGYSPWRVFWSVTLPLVRPALGAGALLVALYALSDFGAPAMMRYDTFTSQIYLQLRGRLDRSAAAILSLALVAISALLLWSEERVQSRGARYYQTDGQWRPARSVPLGRWRWPSAAFAWLVVLASLGLPLGMLLYFGVTGWAGRVDARLASATWNSLLAGGAVALLATLVAFPVAYLAARYRSPFSRLLFRFTYVGYAMPGVVVALAMIFLFVRWLPGLYGTFWALFAGLIVRYLPQALGAQHAGLGQVSPFTEDAARSLGLGPMAVVGRVTLPLIAPSLVSGLALVFLNVLKELPATLLLRPAGFDTLAVRIWVYASEGFYADAAPAALLLIGLAALALAPPLRQVLRGKGNLS